MANKMDNPFSFYLRFNLYVTFNYQVIQGRKLKERKLTRDVCRGKTDFEVEKLADDICTCSFATLCSERHDYTLRRGSRRARL